MRRLVRVDQPEGRGLNEWRSGADWPFGALNLRVERAAHDHLDQNRTLTSSRHACIVTTHAIADLDNLVQVIR